METLVPASPPPSHSSRVFGGKCICSNFVCNAFRFHIILQNIHEGWWVADLTKSSFETHVTGLVFRVLGAAGTCDVIAEGFPGGVRGGSRVPLCPGDPFSASEVWVFPGSWGLRTWFALFFSCEVIQAGVAVLMWRTM